MTSPICFRRAALKLVNVSTTEPQLWRPVTDAIGSDINQSIVQAQTFNFDEHLNQQVRRKITAVMKPSVHVMFWLRSNRRIQPLLHFTFLLCNLVVSVVTGNWFGYKYTKMNNSQGLSILHFQKCLKNISDDLGDMWDHFQSSEHLDRCCFMLKI